LLHQIRILTSYVFSVMSKPKKWKSEMKWGSICLFWIVITLKTLLHVSTSIDVYTFQYPNSILICLLQTHVIFSGYKYLQFLLSPSEATSPFYFIILENQFAK
jgi:hypothetical protein